MPNEADNVLSGVFSQDNADKFKAGMQAQYEERIVKKIMTKAGLEHEIKPLIWRVKSITGKPGLSFAFFHETYGNFPVELAICQIGYVYQTTLPDIFNAPEKSRIVQRWVDRVGEQTTDKAFAMIFDFTGIKGTQLVCHNWDENKRSTATRIRIQLPDNKTVLWIEQFEPFFNEVMAVWQPFSSAEQEQEEEQE